MAFTPTDGINFNQGGQILQNPGTGEIGLVTGTPSIAGREFVFGVDGRLGSQQKPIEGIVALSGSVSNTPLNSTDIANKGYVDNAAASAVAGLATKSYVDQKVGSSTQGVATQQYVQDTVQAKVAGLATQQYVQDKVVQMFKDGQNLAQAGYQKLPNGLLMQWAIVTVYPGQVFNWTYPTAFPNAVFCVFGNAIAGSTSNTADRTVQPVGPGQASCSFSSTYNGGGMPGPTAFMVFAIGY